MTRCAAASAFAAMLVAAGSRPGDALPVFAHRYALTCQACHTAVPHLNDFGQRFLANGYRIAGAGPRGAFPIAFKLNLAYSSQPNPTGLPKAIVDEFEVLSGGALTQRVEYFLEAYALDGGRPGNFRDAWAAYRMPASVVKKVPLRIIAGQFTVPLPVDPETFRETSAHYAVFDQTVGANPFNFFAPRLGVQAAFGNPLAGTSLSIAALDGHDPQSGLRRDGIDRMAYVQHVMGALTPSAYRYDGQRPVCSQGDRFWRQGYGLSYVISRLTLDAVLQNGFDACAGATAGGVRSSGGFAQARYAFSSRLFALLRLDGTTQGADFGRSLLVGGGLRVSRNSRLTVEDSITHAPATRHMLNAGFLFAY